MAQGNFWDEAPVVSPQPTPRRAPQPILSLPDPDKAADNARADAGLENSTVQTGLAVGADQRAADKAERERLEWLATHNPDGSKKPQASDATEAQQKSSLFYGRMLAAEKEYGAVPAGSRDARTIPGQWFHETFPNADAMLNSSARVTADNAARNFIAASLRLESGATISPEEFDRQYRIYFPMPGDGPDQIAAKAKLRQQTIQGFRISSGPLAGQVDQEFQAIYNPSGGATAAAAALPGGQPPAGQPPAAGGVNSPEMRGGLPVGTQITFDGNGDGAPQWWNRDEWLMRTHGVTPDQETQIAAFWNANSGNPNLSPEAIRAWYQQNGLPQPSDAALAQGIAQARDGKVRFGAFNDSADKAAREQQLKSMIDAEARARGAAMGAQGYDPNSAQSYLQTLTEAPLAGLQDEVSGLVAGGGAMLTGGNPMQAYVNSRDANAYRDSLARDAQGAGGEALRVVGSIPTAMSLPGAMSPTVGGAIKAGAGYGALAGFGEGRGAGDSIGGAIGGAALGGAVGGATAAGGQWAINKLASRGGGSGGSTAAQRYADAQDYGLDAISPADVGGMAPKAIERGLDVQPGSAGVMGAQREQLGQQLTDAVGGVADTFGRSTTQRGIGETAQRGAKAYVSESEAAASKLYDAIPIAPDVDAVTTNTVSRLEALTNKITSNPKLAALVQDKRLVGYLDALKGGKLSWNDLKQLRTRIGEEIGQQMFGEKTLKSDLRSLYEALSVDMEATAAAQGGNALKAFQRANTFYSQRAQRIEDVIAPLLGKDGTASPEAAAALIQRISKGGKSSSDLKMLAQIRKTLKPDEWGQVANGLIRELGQPANSPGRAFSPETFVRNFSDMDPAAKNVLFGKSELRANLEKFVGVVEGIAKNNGTRNTSNTGMALSSVIGYGTGGVVGLVAQTALSYGGAKLWTNPAFVRWFTGYSKMLAGAARSGQVNAAAHASQMAALSRLAGAHPEIAPDLGGLRQQLMGALQGGSGPQGALADEGQPTATPTTTQVPQ